MPKKAAASDKDPFDDLPDDLLRRILYFLPGDDALQTCVLGTRWRDIWRDRTRLSFDYEKWSSPTFDRFEKLANLINHVRGNSPLTYCVIHHFDVVDNCGAFTCTKQLIEYVLQCRVKRLRVEPGLYHGHRLQPENYYDMPLPLDDRLISQYLKTIDFEYVEFKHSSLDFSDCPKLQMLTIRDCIIYVRRIVSESLKYLQIIGGCTFRGQSRIQIYTPHLISLELECGDGLCDDLTPLLKKMPRLQTAYVSFGHLCLDYCECNDPSCTCHEECVLLNRLSNAVHLVLTAQPEMSILRWDLASCPIFGKLKTLVLDDWLSTASDLVCILQHTPVLKGLTLVLSNTENFVGATVPQETIEQPILCASLLVVEIECHKIDQGVREILKILSTSGILYKQISIKEWWKKH
ncbi:hypothetical protein QYE76_026481 [Lolium multiflorum]|uniref:F-box domain-containing protein n=1 Tax=Lolium multiflorum TaxID=4521 RepID=A0AAD8RIU5_LOLMU|nr:hypothetical protein QYE76_026481 [Lolium multiflorum]